MIKLECLCSENSCSRTVQEWIRYLIYRQETKWTHQDSSATVIVSFSRQDLQGPQMTYLYIPCRLFSIEPRTQRESLRVRYTARARERERERERERWFKLEWSASATSAYEFINMSFCCFPSSDLCNCESSVGMYIELVSPFAWSGPALYSWSLLQNKWKTWFLSLTDVVRMGLRY